MMEALAGFVEVCKNKFYGTEVERTIDEEISIAKAEVKLGELSVDIQKTTAKITDKDVKKSYIDAVARIRAKQQK